MLKKALDILGPRQTLASVSNRADEIRPLSTGYGSVALHQYSDQAGRHAGTGRGFCPNDGCVVNQIRIDVGVVQDPTKSFAEKQKALKFIVHFVGDRSDTVSGRAKA